MKENDHIWWDAVRAISQEVATFEGKIQHISVFNPGQKLLVQINSEQFPTKPLLQVFLDHASSSLHPEATAFEIKNRIQAKCLQAGTFDQASLSALKEYLPYALLSFWAKQKQRSITVSHFAQSLDGKIATENGESKWIGNEENLIHAHRMRALCDGIMVGSGTLRQDKPSLTVRLVTGKHPKRIVLGASCLDYQSLYKSLDEDILVICADPLETNGRTNYVHLPKGNNGRIDSKLILETLFQRGIYSIYIEGGAFTTSAFLDDQAIDIVQLHYSPLLFGSGVQGIALSPIESVKESIRFKRHQFSVVGDSMMFVGLPVYEES